MIRGLRVVRYLLQPPLVVILVLVVVFFAGIYNYQDINSVHPIVIDYQKGDAGVKIVAFTPDPELLFQGDVLQWKLSRVNTLNAETGENCEKRCEWTMDQNMISNADAVVFLFFTIGFTLEDLPKKARGPNQIWAMHTREPPPFTFCEMDKLNGVFNLTINYRKDSDIWGPYGRKLPNRLGLNKTPILIRNLTLDQWVAGKEELVTQVVSRCATHSQREVLVEKLKQAGVPIHIYGGCGKSFEGSRSDWEDQIGRKYKFYLAFENSICTDYITEKFWRSLELGMVPIVYGGGDYLNEAPPNSYIDVKSFSSAKELSQYLLKLDKEPEEYKKFFEWRKQYATECGGGEWCKFCVALHERKTLKTKATKVYENLDAWFWQRDQRSHVQTACQENPTFFKNT